MDISCRLFYLDYSSIGTVHCYFDLQIKCSTAMSNGDSDKQTCVQNIIKEIKSLENRIGGDEEAVQSLLLLGGQPFESLLDQVTFISYLFV